MTRSPTDPLVVLIAPLRAPADAAHGSPPGDLRPWQHRARDEAGPDAADGTGVMEVT
jgi:hypothetical protein